MQYASGSAPVIVGVDGSRAAANASRWAIDEAISRKVPLRIVHVIDLEEQPAAPYDAFRLDVEYAEMALRGAAAAVHAVGKPVSTETDILWGAVDTTLVKESTAASMICLGSVGIGAVAARLLGSTAMTVAVNAHCPVAVIRSSADRPAAATGWIIAAIGHDLDDDKVLQYAMSEARIRQAPVLAVGVWRDEFGDTPYEQVERRLDEWRQRFPDVHTHPVATRAGVARFLAENRDEAVSLAVVGSRDVDQLARIVGPHRWSILPHGECSVLIVR